MAGYSAYLAYAEQVGFTPVENPRYGLNDPSVAGLRAFIGFHKDHRQTVELAGKLRSLTHKQVAMHGLITRMAVTGEKTTLREMAREAHCHPTTVSRFLQLVQVWRLFAVDTKRGKYGGTTIRHYVDSLAAYAERAWERVRRTAEKALSRTKSNVASLFLRGSASAGSSTTYMDATLKPGEGRGCLVRGCSEDHPEASYVSSTQREAIETRNRAEAWATDVLRERARLAIEDPQGELDAEYPIGWARELRHGVG